MNRRRFSPIALALGIAASFIVRYLTHPWWGFTFTTPRQTTYVGGNIVAFWALIVLSILVSSYLYLVRSKKDRLSS